MKSNDICLVTVQSPEQYAPYFAERSRSILGVTVHRTANYAVQVPTLGQVCYIRTFYSGDLCFYTKMRYITFLYVSFLYTSTLLSQPWLRCLSIINRIAKYSFICLPQYRRMIGVAGTQLCIKDRECVQIFLFDGLFSRRYLTNRISDEFRTAT